MSDSRKFDPEKVKMLDYKLIKGQIDMPEDFEITDIKDYELENSLQLGFSLEEKLMKVDFNFTVKTISESANASESVGQYHFVFVYSVGNLEELSKREENKLVEIDANLAASITAISYSTSRGILLVRMQGTAFQNFILPIIDPNKLLNNQN